MIQELWLGDCLELMSRIPDKSIDLIVCDPPYGTTVCSWDVVIPFADLWSHYHRIAKPTTPILLFGQEPFSSYLRLSNPKQYRYDLYWQKERLTNIFQVNKMPGKVIETISVFYQKQPVYHPQKTSHTGTLKIRNDKADSWGELVCKGGKTPRPTYRDDSARFPLQIVKFNREMTATTIHPTQKPLALLEYLIKTYSNEEDLILDNTMGSGTVCLAAKNLKRNYIGIEKDPDIYWKARRRIGETVPSILYKTEKGE